MTGSSTADGKTAAKLVQAVYAASAEARALSLSSRTVAGSAGVSASAINYTFGSLAELIDEARRQADRAAADFWNNQRKTLEIQGAQTADIAPLVFITTRQLISEHPGGQALFWKDVIESARLDKTTRFGAGFEAEHLYWDALLRRSGLHRLKAAIVQALSLALRFGYQVFQSPGAFDTWALALVNRFTVRVSGMTPETGTDSAVRAHAEQVAGLDMAPLDVSNHETARLILGTTVKTVLEAGADAATFREIARRSGLSVSSVQHFFGSRQAYLTAAFRTIFASAKDRAIKSVPEPRSLTIAELSAYFEREHPQTPLLPHSEFAAIQGLMLSAAQAPETLTLAQGLLARTGQTSLQLLNALKSPRGKISRLDAQLLSLILTHLVTLEITGRVPTKDGEGLDNLAKNLLAALFE
ncbi:MAG: TetR/AcrR family transcriptional regulator [Pseudomonadota bacterium]